MNPILSRAASVVLTGTGLQYLPVRARRGFIAGERWTLFPWTSYWRGAHEPAVGQAIDSLGDFRGKSCWDLGAHFGYYAVGLARRTGPTGQVAAFEPFPSSFARVERHARLNGLTWIKAYEAAVSDADGTAELIADMRDGDTGVHLPYDANERPHSTAEVITVRLLRLDGLVERGEIRAPDFMKVDVEGHGAAALAGAMKSIAANRPIILMAFHSAGEVAGTEALLNPLGYRWEPLDPHAPPDRCGHDYLLRPA